MRSIGRGLSSCGAKAQRFVPAFRGSAREEAGGVHLGTGIRAGDGWLLIRADFGLVLGELGESAE
jgi:hypothetical protein